MAKIAVVEDNDAMRAQLCGFIAQYAQESGHQLDVTAFSDGAQLVEPYRPGFDIIFLDIEMPTLGGMPTAERIRRQDPDVVLVFVTNMAQYAIRGYEVDALDFVLKPVSYYQFSTKLERALQRIQRRRQSAYEDYQDALISKGDYLRYRADYDAQEQALQAQLDKLRDSVQDEPLSLPWVKELLASGQLAELDRPTVAAAIREIRVYEGNRIEIDYLLPEGCRALLEG